MEEYESKGVYSSKSLYAIVNFRGVQPIYLPAVWNVKVPPRVQGFLWLFSQNKIMTCDNLRKRGIVKPLECVFCKEIEYVRHLLFDCVVARLVWAEVNTVFNISVVGFESVAKYWFCAKKCKQLNVVSSAVLWGLWNFRNSVVFNRCSWISMTQVLGLVYRYLRDWTKLFQDLQGGKMHEFQRSDLENPEKSVDAGTRLSCRKWFEDQSVDVGLWKKAVGNAAHGGRATLEYQLQHQEESDSIHVVSIGGEGCLSV